MDDRVEAALSGIAPEVDFPPAPDLRAAVAEGIARPARPWWRPAAVPRAMVLALIATLLVVATAAALALALPGLRIILVPNVPPASVADDPVGGRLALGEPVAPDTLDTGIPSVLGTPDEAYVLGDREVLSLVYHARDDLPALAGSDVGLLVQRIDGVLDRSRIEKLVPEIGASVTHVEVDGADGFWIEGPPHRIRYLSPAGRERLEASRLVGDALVWERDGVLYRIESGLGRVATIEIAETIEPEDR